MAKSTWQHEKHALSTTNLVQYAHIVAIALLYALKLIPVLHKGVFATEGLPLELPYVTAAELAKRRFSNAGSVDFPPGKSAVARRRKPLEREEEGLALV